MKGWAHNELLTALGIAMTPETSITPSPRTAASSSAAQALSGFDELAAGITSAPNLSEVEAAATVLANAGTLRGRDGWRDYLLFPLADAAREHPSLTEDLKAIFERVSRAAGGNTTDNDRQWVLAVGAVPAVRRTLGSLFVAARDHGWQRTPAALPPQSNVGHSITLRPRPLDLSIVPSHREWELGTRLIRGEVSILAAPGGRAKTAVAVAWAASLSCGRSLIGEHVFGTRKKVVFISTEDNCEELNRRFLALAMAHGLTPADLANISILGVDHGRFSLTHGSDRAPQVNQAAIDWLASTVRELEAGVVILDPLGPLVPIGLNDNGLMGGLISALKRCAYAERFALLLLHHFKKGSDGSAESVSGASALVNHARAAFTIESMNDRAAGDRGILPSEQWRYVRLADLKVNLAPRGAEDDWLYISSVSLPNAQPPVYPTGDNVQAITLAPKVAGPNLDPATQLRIETEFIAEVLRAARASRPLHATARGLPRGAPTATTVLRDLIAASSRHSTQDAERIAGTLFQSMLDRGLIEDVEVKTGRGKKRRGIVAPEPEAA